MEPYTLKKKEDIFLLLNKNNFYKIGNAASTKFPLKNLNPSTKKEKKCHLQVIYIIVQRDHQSSAITGNAHEHR